jgi:hypothetical protein
MFSGTKIRHVQTGIRVEDGHESCARDPSMKKQHLRPDDDVDLSGTGQREQRLGLLGSPNGFTIHSANPDVRKMLLQQLLHSLSTGPDWL